MKPAVTPRHLTGLLCTAEAYVPVALAHVINALTEELSMQIDLC